jgi:phage gpG-like protein
MPTVNLVIRREDLFRAVLPTVLRAIRDRGRDVRPTWPAVLNVIYSYEAQLFRQRGETPDSPQWAPLSPLYEQWKSKHYPGRGILELTGELMRQFGEGGASVVRGQTRLELHTDLPLPWTGGIDDKGGIHMSGRSGGTRMGRRLLGREFGLPNREFVSTAMPARPPIEIQEGEVIEITDILARYVMGGVLPR